MRRMILPLMVLVAVACQPATIELTDAERAAIADTVSTLMADEWIASTDPVDFEKMMTLIQNAPETALAFEGGIVHGWTTMEAVFGGHFASISREPCTITDSATVVLASDMVYVMRSGTFTSIDTAGSSGPLTPFAQTLLWVRRDGAWKVLVGHVSHGPPIDEG